MAERYTIRYKGMLVGTYPGETVEAATASMMEDQHALDFALGPNADQPPTTDFSFEEVD